MHEHEDLHSSITDFARTGEGGMNKERVGRSRERKSLTRVLILFSTWNTTVVKIFFFLSFTLFQ